MTTTCALGLDVGSTYVKVLAVTTGGVEICGGRRPTPWTTLPGGRAEMDALTLVATVADLLAELADRLRADRPDARVVGIGVSGMAEAGVLLDRNDNVVRPIIAWFDPRGGDETADLPADLRASFPGRTGLPLGPIATFAKLLHHRTHGLDLTGLQWLTVAEYVAWALGSERLAEVSLIARTGLVDQDTGAPWPEALDALGVDAALVPPIATAGTVWGKASTRVPPEMAGAVLSVAGHDHLVASVAAGVLATDQMYDSMGTAEALVRVLDGPLDAAARERLARHGVNVQRHMLPGKGIMLAGTKSGLLLRRVLQMVGISDADGRTTLDRQVMRLADGGGPAAAALQVTGAANDDGVFSLRADGDGLSPAVLFAATLAHGTELLRAVVAHMDAEVSPARHTVVAGGWAGMASVRRARRAALPDVSFSDRPEDTAFGAALVGAFAADPAALDLTDFASEFRAGITPTSEGQYR